MDKKRKIAIILITAVIVAALIIFLLFSSIGAQSHKNIAETATQYSENVGDVLFKTELYRDGLTDCEEFLESIDPYEEAEYDILECYLNVRKIPVYERAISDSEAIARRFEKNSDMMRNFMLGMSNVQIMMGNTQITEPLKNHMVDTADLVTVLVQTTGSGYALDDVYGYMRNASLVSTQDNIIVETDEDGLRELSACMLEAAEEGTPSVNGLCREFIPDEYAFGISDSEFLIAYGQIVLDKLLEDTGSTDNAVEYHERGDYLEAMVRTSMILGDLEMIEQMGCGTNTTKTSLHECFV